MPSGSCESFRNGWRSSGWKLHPEKTRLIEFGRFAVREPEAAWRGETGDVHVSGLHALLWDELGAAAAFMVWRRHGEKRMAAKLQAIKAGACAAGCTSRWREVGAWLKTGGARAITNTMRCRATWLSLSVFRAAASAATGGAFYVVAVSGGKLDWERLRPIFDRWIPRPRILHPYPDERFDATHPR